MIKLISLLFFVLAAGTASAQTTTTNCTTVGASTTCTTPPGGQFDYLHNAGQKDFERAGQGLANLLSMATQPRAAPANRINDVTIYIKGGKYVAYLISYADGRSTPLDVSAANETVDVPALIKFCKQFQMVHVVDEDL